MLTKGNKYFNMLDIVEAFADTIFLLVIINLTLRSCGLCKTLPLPLVTRSGESYENRGTFRISTVYFNTVCS